MALGAASDFGTSFDWVWLLGLGAPALLYSGNVPDSSTYMFADLGMGRRRRAGAGDVMWNRECNPRLLLEQKLGGSTARDSWCVSVCGLMYNTRRPQKFKDQLRKSHVLEMGGGSQLPK